MAITTIILLIQESSDLVSNIEKAGIIGLLATGIIYAYRKINSQDKEIKTLTDSRINDMKQHANEVSALLEKVLVSKNESKEDVQSMIKIHEATVVEHLKEQMRSLHEKLNQFNGNK